MVQEKMKKRVTLQQLIKDNLPVWVRNTTGNPETGQEPGDICLQVSSVHRMPPVVIPPGMDPVCITDQIDPDALKGFRDLFTAIQKGALELLDPEEAENYYQENEDRKNVMEDKIDRYINNRPDEKMWVKEVTSTDVKIKPKVLDLCQRAKHSAVEERFMLERLMELSSILKESDYSYLASNGKFASVISWAKDQLKAQQEQTLKSLG